MEVGGDPPPLHPKRCGFVGRLVASRERRLPTGWTQRREKRSHLELFPTRRPSCLTLPARALTMLWPTNLHGGNCSQTKTSDSLEHDTINFSKLLIVFCCVECLSCHASVTPNMPMWFGYDLFFFFSLLGNLSHDATCRLLLGVLFLQPLSYLPLFVLHMWPP